jgi:hypothetical protein
LTRHPPSLYEAATSGGGLRRAWVRPHSRPVAGSPCTQ